MSSIIEGNLVATGLETVIIASRFNSFIVEKLVDGAKDALVRHGADASSISVVWVPGAWEITLVAQHVIQQKKGKAATAAAARLPATSASSSWR
jgi:6,7-dimethyl-8-ribityllumazine synthase